MTPMQKIESYPEYLRQKADVLRRVYLAHNIANDLDAAADKLQQDERLLGDALKQMEANHYAVADRAPHADVMAHVNTIDALRARLGG